MNGILSIKKHSFPMVQVFFTGSHLDETLAYKNKDKGFFFGGGRNNCEFFY